MIERCFDICLSQGRPDLKVQCVAKVVDPERKTATGRLRATGGAWGRLVRKIPSRREYPETTRVGDCFSSIGPAAGNGS